MTIAAMKAALEALEYIDTFRAGTARLALRASITDQEQCEPVAEVVPNDSGFVGDVPWHCNFLTTSLHIGDKLFTHPAPVPAGWRLVPVEPTPEMISAMYQCLTTNIENNSNDLYDSYKAMLAAAPKEKS